MQEASVGEIAAGSAASADSNGAGLGASHQTGWTGAIARLMQPFAIFTPETALGVEKTIEPKQTSDIQPDATLATG